MPSMLCQRWVDNYCMDTLETMFDFEYWDCSAFTFPSNVYANSIQRPFLKKIPTLEALEKGLANLPQDTLLCTDIHLTRENYTIHKTISKYFNKIIVFTFWDNEYRLHELYTDSDLKRGASPKPINNKIWNRRVEKLINLILSKDSYLYVLGKMFLNHTELREIQRTYYELKNLKLYSQFVFVGAAPHRQYRINLPDVERYLKAKGSTDFSQKYIVFVDEFFPMHPDLLMFEKKELLQSNEDEYINSINTFFEQVEKRYSCEVIIALHPSANYAKNIFKGRKMYKNMTCELIRDSIGVIMHESCSLSYVVMYDKPVMIVANDAIKRVQFTYSLVRKISTVIGVDILDVDHCLQEDIKFSKVPEANRDFYMKQCLFIDDINIKPNKKRIPQCLNEIYMKYYGK